MISRSIVSASRGSVAVVPKGGEDSLSAQAGRSDAFFDLSAHAGEIVFAGLGPRATIAAEH